MSAVKQVQVAALGTAVLLARADAVGVLAPRAKVAARVSGGAAEAPALAAAADQASAGVAGALGSLGAPVPVEAAAVPVPG